MFARYLRGFLLLCLVGAVAGCGNPSGLDSIQVTPSTQALTVGQTAQFTAVGTFGNARHLTTQTLTTGVTWASSTPSVATVDPSGLVTAVAPGTTNITAGATAYNGDVSASSALTVTVPAGGGGGGKGSILSLTIIPSEITVGNLQDTGQFLAIGTFSVAPFVRDLTNSPTLTWISATPSVFPVSTNTAGSPGATAGIVTAYGNGGGVITAEARNPDDGTIQTANATFSCPLVLPTPTTAGSCFPGSQAPALLATLTVYNEGLNTADWQVTAASATGTPNVIDCGPASPTGSVCEATYPFTTTSPNTSTPVATKVTLKATGGKFGGWSYNCIPSDANGNVPPAGQPPITINEAGPNYCTFTFADPNDPNSTINTNVTVGAIFN